MSMYYCRSCRGNYCEEHRTKPAHSCCEEDRIQESVEDASAAVAEQKRIQEVFASVERRFDSEQKEQLLQPKSHFQAVVTPSDEELSSIAEKDALFAGARYFKQYDLYKSSYICFPCQFYR